MFDLAAHFSECLYDYEKPTYPFFGYMPQNKLKEEDIIELVKYSIVFKKEIDK
jgi:hypothetical protein